MRIVVAVLFILLLAWSYAYPRDPDGRYAASPLKPWFDSLKSGKGPCCSDADGALVKDADWDSKDGHYRVRIDGKWIDVPENALITEPNKYGPAIVWGYRIGGFGGGSYEIRCFIPGSMT